MKTIFLAVTFSGPNAPTPEQFIADAKEQISFKYDADSFQVTPLEATGQLGHITSPSEAIYALLTVLSTQKEKVVLSSKNDPSRVLEIANNLIDANGWPMPQANWEKTIEFPSILQEIEDRKKEMVNGLFAKKKVAKSEAENTAEAPLAPAEDALTNEDMAQVLGANEADRVPELPETDAAAIAPAPSVEDPFKVSE